MGRIDTRRIDEWDRQTDRQMDGETDGKNEDRLHRVRSRKTSRGQIFVRVKFYLPLRMDHRHFRGCRPFLRLSYLSPPTSLSVCLSACICLPIFMFISVSVCLSVCLFLSARVCLCLSSLHHKLSLQMTLFTSLSRLHVWLSGGTDTTLCAF